MECNKEEASRAKDLAVVKLQEGDYAGAKRIALKAQKLFPGLENISQLLTVCEVHCCAAVKINGETDWYGILQVEATADDMLLKKQYRKLALLLHPDKNKFVGAEAAFKLIGEAHKMLTDKVNRLCHDSKWDPVIPKSAPKQRGRPSKKTDYANKENTDAGYSTFWTICLTCGTKYQYPYSLRMEVLWCEICSKRFIAYDLSEKPFVGVEALNPRSGFAMEHQMFPPSQWTHVANQQHNYQSVPTWLDYITGNQIPVPNLQQQPRNVSVKQTPDINLQQRSQKFPFCSVPKNVVNSHPWVGSGMQQEMCPPCQPTHVSDQTFYYQRAPGQQNPVNGHQTRHSHPWDDFLKNYNPRSQSGMQQEMYPLSEPTHVSDQNLYYQRASGQQNPVNVHQTPHSHPWGGYGMQQEMCPPSQPTHISDQKLYYQRSPGQQNPANGHQTPVSDCQQQFLKVVDKNTSVTTQQQSTKPPFNSGSKNVVSSQGAAFPNNNATANSNLTAEAGACNREKITRPSLNDENGEDRTKSPVVNCDTVHLVNEQMKENEVATGSSHPVAINGSQVATKDVLTATSADKTAGQHPCTESRQRNNVIVEDGSDGCGKVSDNLPDSPAKKRIRKEHSTYTGGKCDHTTENEVAEANSQHKCSIPSKEKVTNEKGEVISGLNHDGLQGTKRKQQTTSSGSGSNAAARSVNNIGPYNVTVSYPDLDFYINNLKAEAGAFNTEKITRPSLNDENGEDRTKSPVVNCDKVHLVNEQMRENEVATGSSHPVAINGSQVATKDVLTATSADKTPGQHPCTESQQRNNVIVEDGSDGCGKVSDNLPDSPAKKRIRKEHSSYTGGKSDCTTENKVAEANSQHKCSIPSKEKVTNEKQEVISGLNHDVLQGTKGKQQTRSSGSGSNAAARSVNNSSPCNVTVSCPDLDFYDFEKNRDADRFIVDQIWAIYDNLDGMPRHYARIKQVYSPNFMLELTRLEHDPMCDAEKEWSSKELPVACGNFRVGRTLLTEDTFKMFSHVVSWTKGMKMNRYEIYPKKGEVWALFRGWDIKWISDSNDHRHYDYDIVEITSDFDTGLGTYVIPLVKIKGSVSLFVRSSNIAPFLIPSGHTLSFSHSIPFHRLAETDRQHIPNGALKLDTASLPSDLEKAFTPMNLDSSFMSTRDGNTQCHVPSTSSCQVPVGKTKQSQDGTGTNVKDEVEKLNQNPRIEPWFLRRQGKTWRVAHSRATPRRA